jgi:SAM-dependent methyltransferase
MIDQNTHVVPYDPEFYEMLHQGSEGDLQFYRQVCQGAQSVLELGCGAGRVALELARQGLFVHGLDNNQDMLDLLGRRWAAKSAKISGSLTFEKRDMTRFQLSKKFDRVIIPYNGLYCLLTEEEVRKNFKMVKEHLKPDGLFVFDAYRVFEPDPDVGEDSYKPVACMFADYGEIEILERSEWDQPSQRIDAYYLYKVARGDQDEEHEFVIPQRYLFPQDIRKLLEESGFTIEKMLGSFSGETFNDNSEHIIVKARHGS